MMLLQVSAFLIKLQFLILCVLCCCICSVSAKPLRIISMDPATDTLVLQLADLDRIVAVRERTQDPEVSLQWEKALQLITLRNEMAEEVYRLQPDLVFFGPWSNRATRNLLKRLQVPALRLQTPKNWEDVYANIADVGNALGEEERAAKMSASMRRRLSAIEKRLRGQPLKRGLFYIGRGHTYGKNSKAHFVMESAGVVNIAAEKGIVGLGMMSIEEVLMSAPDMIIFSDYKKDVPTLSRNVLDHPVFPHIANRVILTEVPSNKINMTDASLVDCVELLAKTLYPHLFQDFPTAMNNYDTSE